jgi:hypothetical protein
MSIAMSIWHGSDGLDHTAKEIDMVTMTAWTEVKFLLGCPESLRLPKPIFLVRCM